MMLKYNTLGRCKNPENPVQTICQDKDVMRSLKLNLYEDRYLSRYNLMMCLKGKTEARMGFHANEDATEMKLA